MSMMSVLYANDLLDAVEVVQRVHELPDHVVQPGAESSAGDDGSSDLLRVEVGGLPRSGSHPGLRPAALPLLLDDIVEDVVLLSDDLVVDDRLAFSVSQTTVREVDG